MSLALMSGLTNLLIRDNTDLSLTKRLIYGRECGWIFYPYDNQLFESTIRDKKIERIYQEWKRTTLPVFGVSGLSLWPGLEDPRTDKDIKNLKHEAVSIEEQVKSFTPNLQPYVFAKERTKAVVEGINGDADLITVRSHNYFGDYSCYYTRYTFFKSDVSNFPLIYAIRSKISKVK